eukprot:Skav226384  [mRNA]  locus=scaffold1028:952:4557:- [translate_table: standard]
MRKQKQDGGSSKVSTGSKADGGKDESSSKEVSPGFTFAEVEDLIQQAEERAKEDLREAKGSNPGTSQSWAHQVREKVTHLLSSSPQGTSFGQVARVLNDLLEILHDDDLCRPMSTVGKRSIFPLPIPEEHGDLGDKFGILTALTRGLNSLHGCAASSTTNSAALCAQKRLTAVVRDCGFLEEPIQQVNFAEFFRHRGLDYQGDEVRVAKAITWRGVAGSLPDEVGTLDILQYCEGGVKHFIQNMEDYIVPEEMQVIGKTPRTMVSDDEWPQVAQGLIECGLCEVMDEKELFHVKGQPLKNGLFAVSKDEFVGDVELLRLIMNLKPLNQITRAMDGDTSTLPSVTSLGTLFLDEEEVLCTSSEDIRCFFYLFRLPRFWFRYLAFGKAVPDRLLPKGVAPGRGFLVARVLPMGYANSVAVAQHVHRRVVRQCMGSMHPPVGAEQESRRDKFATSSSSVFRVYLDNFDFLEKLEFSEAEVRKGKVSPVVEELRRAYDLQGLPRHPKKATEQQWLAEGQGALVDGQRGVISAKPAKVAKYIAMTLELLKHGRASQRELQVVGGGLVYLCMFKRPLLCGLNKLWKVIVGLEGAPRSWKVPLCKELTVELVRFLALLPLAYINLRAGFAKEVTASDASLQGGGACVSKGLTPYGVAASRATIRGDLPEKHDFVQVLTVGLFDGIGALRVAADILGLPLAGHVAVECSPTAQRVMEANFSEVIQVSQVEEVDEEAVRGWSLRFSSVGLVLVGAGPPCQGVSGLNSDRRGALKDVRSCLFQHVPRITSLIKKYFVWAQVHDLVESVASMDYKDCETMSNSLGTSPWFIDSCGVSLAHRPRVYWVSWELYEEQGVTIRYGSDGRLPIQGEVQLEAVVDEKEFLEPGCSKYSTKSFPTFTTARPSPFPLRKPAGLAECSPHEVARWKAHDHRFPPYQYRDVHCVSTPTGELRPPSITEREIILGFPAGYTKQCLSKQHHGSQAHQDARLTLVGNSWSVPVIAWLVSCLVFPLGLAPKLSLQQIVELVTPGKSSSLQMILQRPSLKVSTKTAPLDCKLVQKLCGLVSLKGQDLLLQQQSAQPVRSQRLRASLPSKLWRWANIAGWQWTGDTEHINVLELRAAYTTIRYRVKVLRQWDVRFVHLLDSMVVLHGLTRGRSSSRKMKRTLMRLNSLLLVTGLQATWAYVDTKENPADKPSRWGVKKRWLKVKHRN